VALSGSRRRHLRRDRRRRLVGGCRIQSSSQRCRTSLEGKE
jgi:hypothetical protein